jgi:hypothetical protein
MRVYPKTARQCPGVIIIPATHCKLANLNRIYNHSNIADNTAVLATDSDPVTASQKLQANLDAIHKWRIRGNGSM